MTFKIIAHQSKAYSDMIRLRVNVLLLPSGIPESYIVPETEAADILIGAFDGQKIVGCCVLTDRGEGQVQLRQMAVDSNLQHSGLGKSIIAFAEKTAAEKGFRLLYLHARNEVIGFYEKCSYKIAGEEFFEVGLGHHRMEKKLEMAL